MITISRTLPWSPSRISHPTSRSHPTVVATTDTVAATTDSIVATTEEISALGKELVLPQKNKYQLNHTKHDHAPNWFVVLHIFHLQFLQHCMSTHPRAINEEITFFILLEKNLLPETNKFFFFNSGTRGLEGRRSKKKSFRAPSKVEGRRSKIKILRILAAEFDSALPMTKI